MSTRKPRKNRTKSSNIDLPLEWSQHSDDERFLFKIANKKFTRTDLTQDPPMEIRTNSLKFHSMQVTNQVILHFDHDDKDEVWSFAKRHSCEGRMMILLKSLLSPKRSLSYFIPTHKRQRYQSHNSLPAKDKDSIIGFNPKTRELLMLCSKIIRNPSFFGASKTIYYLSKVDLRYQASYIRPHFVFKIFGADIFEFNSDSAVFSISKRNKNYIIYFSGQSRFCLVYQEKYKKLIKKCALPKGKINWKGITLEFQDDSKSVFSFLVDISRGGEDIPDEEFDIHPQPVHQRILNPWLLILDFDDSNFQLVEAPYRSQNGIHHEIVTRVKVIHESKIKAHPERDISEFRYKDLYFVFMIDAKIKNRYEMKNGYGKYSIGGKRPKNLNGKNFCKKENLRILNYQISTGEDNKVDQWKFMEMKDKEIAFYGIKDQKEVESLYYAKRKAVHITGKLSKTSQTKILEHPDGNFLVFIIIDAKTENWCVQKTNISLKKTSSVKFSKKMMKDYELSTFGLTQDYGLFGFNPAKVELMLIDGFNKPKGKKTVKQFKFDSDIDLENFIGVFNDRNYFNWIALDKQTGYFSFNRQRQIQVFRFDCETSTISKIKELPANIHCSVLVPNQNIFIAISQDANELGDKVVAYNLENCEQPLEAELQMIKLDRGWEPKWRIRKMFRIGCLSYYGLRIGSFLDIFTYNSKENVFERVLGGLQHLCFGAEQRSWIKKNGEQNELVFMYDTKVGFNTISNEVEKY